MKKVSIVLATLAVIGSMSFSSCKKCTTCTATDKTSGAVYYESAEACGNKATIDSYESSFKTVYGTDYNVVCE